MKIKHRIKIKKKKSKNNNPYPIENIIRKLKDLYLWNDKKEDENKKKKIQTIGSNLLLLSTNWFICELILKRCDAQHITLNLIRNGFNKGESRFWIIF